MSVLQKLSISKLRNINFAEIRPSSSINIFYGENGSGKSTALEAIHLLGLARSFRSNSQKPLIQHGEKESTVFAELSDKTTIGVTKGGRLSQQIKISGRKAEKTAELAKCLPLQVLNSDTFKILEGSPKIRRHYLDWGVFHVEHCFLEQWRQGQIALQNRNSLLKRGASKSEIDPWTQEFVKYAESIDGFRQVYVETLQPIVSSILAKLIDLKGLNLEYDRGWDKDIILQDLMSSSFNRDLRYGYTVAGPQRADLKIKIGQNHAIDILSRGQQKLLVSALKIAQGALLERENNKNCVYLIDDLPAELDEKNRKKVCELLSSLNCQLFITSVDASSLDGCWDGIELEGKEKKLFHVKHGKISE